MKIRKELWFGFALMFIILVPVVMYTPWAGFADGHLDHADLGALGLLMLALIVVAIMLGFPTAFTLMGMGVFFGWLAYRSVNPALANQQILDLMVQRAYSVMSNDVLIAIPLFVFMGYLVERANLIEKLFKSLHLALARVPGALAVATIVTCAIFATATGIVGAVVTLMGLLALPAMLRAGYNIKVAAGAITAGGCLGILIPPSVLLIVYGATAGVSVVKLYAGAFFPGDHAGGPVRSVRHHHRQVEAASGTAALGSRARGATAAAVADARATRPKCAHGTVWRAARSGAAQAASRDAVLCLGPARNLHHCAAGTDVWCGDGAHCSRGYDRSGAIGWSDHQRGRLACGGFGACRTAAGRVGAAGATQGRRRRQGAARRRRHCRHRRRRPLRRRQQSPQRQRPTTPRLPPNGCRCRCGTGSCWPLAWRAWRWSAGS